MWKNNFDRISNQSVNESCDTELNKTDDILARSSNNETEMPNLSVLLAEKIVMLILDIVGDLLTLSEMNCDCNREQPCIR